MALDCIDYGCDDSGLSDFHVNPCNKEFLGNHSKAILFGCDATTTDFTNSAQILADRIAGRAWLIPSGKFTINKPTINKTDSIIPCAPSSVDSVSYTGDYANPHVNTENDDVHGILFSGKSFGAMLLNECQSTKDGYYRVKLIQAQIKFEGGLVSTTGEKQRYEGQYAWEGVHPLTIAEAPGIFDAL